MNKIKPANGLNRQDRQFLKDAAAANWMEIRSSEIAQTNARSAWAKHFGADMITDHKAAQAEVEQLAGRKRVTLPSTAPEPLRRRVEGLRSLHGARFDTAYRQLQIAGHRMTADKLAQEIRNGRDSQVRGLAIKLLPAVKMHLRLAMSGGTMTRMQH